MELRQLRYFVALAKHRNFHRAAEELCLTQQALSASISALETELGVPLIERGRHGAIPTRFGEALLPRAHALLGDVRAARAELEGMLDARQGPLRVGVGSLFSQHVFPQALIQFLQQFPSVDVTVVEGLSVDLYAALIRTELDFVVSTPADGLAMPAELEYEVLFQTRDAVFVSTRHPLARRENATLADLTDWPWLVPSRFDTHSERLLAAFVSRGLAPPSRILHTDSVALIGAVLQGSDCVSLLGRNPFEDLMLGALGDLKAFEVPELSGLYRGVVAWRRTALLPAARNLIDLLRQAIRCRLASDAT
jgi:DNA-binding transcriptional LysR family regulator